MGEIIFISPISLLHLSHHPHGRHYRRQGVTADTLTCSLQWNGLVESHAGTDV